MKDCPTALHLSQSRFKILPNTNLNFQICPRLLKFCLSSKISPNLATLVQDYFQATMNQTIFVSTGEQILISFYLTEREKVFFFNLVKTDSFSSIFPSFFNVQKIKRWQFELIDFSFFILRLEIRFLDSIYFP